MSSSEKVDMVVATAAAYQGDEKNMNADEKRLAEMGTNHHFLNLGTIR